MTIWLQDPVERKKPQTPKKPNHKPAFCISWHFDPDSRRAKLSFHTTRLAKSICTRPVLPSRKSVKCSKVPLVPLILLQQALTKTEQWKCTVPGMGLHIISNHKDLYKSCNIWFIFFRLRIRLDMSLGLESFCTFQKGSLRIFFIAKDLAIEIWMCWKQFWGIS